MKKTQKKYELILVLVNQGFTDAIIDAARKAGATGGTILAARADAKKKAENNYGLVLAQDKDLISILADSSTKNKIMSAIYAVSGIETKGMAIIFTVPADNVVGLRKNKK